MNGWMHVETSPLVPYRNPLEQRSPLLPNSVFNNSNNNFGNALYLLNNLSPGSSASHFLISRRKTRTEAMKQK